MTKYIKYVHKVNTHIEAASVHAGLKWSLIPDSHAHVK